MSNKTVIKIKARNPQDNDIITLSRMGVTLLMYQRALVRVLNDLARYDDSSEYIQTSCDKIITSLLDTKNINGEFDSKDKQQIKTILIDGVEDIQKSLGSDRAQIVTYGDHTGRIPQRRNIRFNYKPKEMAVYICIPYS